MNDSINSFWETADYRAVPLRCSFVFRVHEIGELIIENVQLINVVLKSIADLSIGL